MAADTQYCMQIHPHMDGTTWNRLLFEMDSYHILQSYQWAEIKQQNGWQPIFITWCDAGQKIVAAAAIHLKRLPVLGSLTRTCILYCPRGPVMDWGDSNIRNQVIHDLMQFAREQKSIFIKIDPELPLGWSQTPSEPMVENHFGQLTQEELQELGWIFSQDQLQFRNTVLLNIECSEDQLLERLKQKTRYNIRLSAKKGVQVRAGNKNDLDFLYKMYALTSLRDGFAIRSHEYYLEVWTHLMEEGIAHPLIAEVDGEVVAAIILFVFGKRGYYFYGMSTNKHRDKMPNHLLQWEGIRLCKLLGCTSYDFWGAPDEFNQEDPMYGVYRFKEGFSGNILFGIGAWDFPVTKIGYKFYTVILPEILGVMRKLGRRRVAREVQQ